MRKPLVLLSLLVAPTAFADRYAYVTSKTDASVSVIDVENPTVVATIPVGPDPRGVVVHPDGNTVYVTARGPSPSVCSDTLYVIDAPSHTVRQTVTLTLNCPTGIAIDPAGDYLYIAHDYSEYVTRIPTLTLDPNAIEEIYVGHSGGTFVAVDPENDVLYEVFSDPTTGGGTVAWYDMTNGYAQLGVRDNLAPFPGALVPWVDHLIFLTRQTASGGRQMISLDTKGTGGLVIPITSTGNPAGIALRPIVGAGFPTYHVTRRSTNEIVQIFGAQTYGTQATPVALAWSDDEDDTISREAFISANQGAGSATVARGDGTVVHVAVGGQPQAVAAGPVLRPRLEWRPHPLEFFYVAFLKPATLRLKLTNSGAGRLDLLGMTLEGVDMKAFKLGKSDCPTRLLAGKSCGVDVTFTASAKDGEKYPIFKASLQLRANDGTHLVPLVGRTGTGK